MSTRSSLSVVLLAFALSACSAGEGAAPTARSQLVDAPARAVYPASSYRITALPDTGWLSDINEKHYMVGTISTRAGAWVNAFALQRGGTPKLLASGGALASAAMAVNSGGAITGALDFGYSGTPLSPDIRPAVWSNASSAPLVAPLRGVAYDINDAGMVVGTAIKAGGQYGFVWDTAGGPVLLPPLRGGTNSNAFAITADRIILGASSSSSGWQYVLWKYNGSTWLPTPITGGISALAIDEGNTVVGQTAGQASWGKPNHAGFFGVGFQSYASAVTKDGWVAVGPAWSPVAGPASSGNSFVADRSGAVTMLPIPNFVWTTVTARGVNKCGVVVGSMTYNSMAAHPTYWDPGC